MFHRIVKGALRALSYSDIDVRKNYRLKRRLVNLMNFDLMKPFYRTWDHKIHFRDYDIPVRIFSPPKDERQDILLFFHGGGWVTGNIDSYTRVCASMAKLTGRRVVSVDYRLAPEYRFPAAPEDCYRVAREIYLDNSLLDVDRNHITLIGDSAGANLAAAVSLMARDRGEFEVARQILIYPATHYNHTPNSPFASVRDNGTDYLLTSRRICDYMDLYMSGPEDLQNPYFAPLTAQDFSRQPKTLVITAEYDPLRDEGEAYAAKLRESGADVTLYRMADGLHGFFSLPAGFPQVKRAYALINHFLQELA